MFGQMTLVSAGVVGDSERRVLGVGKLGPVCLQLARLGYQLAELRAAGSRGVLT